MSEKTWMPLFIGDYLADTQRLTAEQHGAYLLLIMDYWRSGSLPNDDEVLNLITKGAWTRHKGVLLNFFQQDGATLRHSRIEKEIAEAAEKHKKAKEKATAAASKRWGKDATSSATSNTSGISQAMHKQCPSPSPSPSPSSLQTTLKEPPTPTGGFDDFWKVYPRKTSKGQAKRAWTAAAKKADPPQILEALQSQIDTWRREARQPEYIPHPATWLNGERWLDEPPDKPKTASEILDEMMRGPHANL